MQVTPQPVNVPAGTWKNEGPPAGFGGEYARISGLKYGCILIQASKAEADLIAAAPALLAALKKLLPAYRNAVKLHDPNHHDALTVDAHNAIVAAQGGAA